MLMSSSTALVIKLTRSQILSRKKLRKLKFIKLTRSHESWKTEGSVKLWTYVIDGKVEVFKERLKIDEETKTVTAVGIEGDCMKHYKKFTGTIQVISRGGSNFAKFSIDYEKINENEPAPTKYLDWLVHTGKDLDASLIKA